METPHTPDADRLRAWRRAAPDNIVRLEFLKRLAANCAAGRIDLLTLKGAALLGREYPHVGAREMADIDLLVRRSDAGRLNALLTSNGATPSSARSSDPRRPSGYHQQWHVPAAGGRGTLLELHSGFVPHDWVTVNYEAVFAWSDPHPLKDLAVAGVRRPCPEHLLTHLALHRLKHGYRDNAGDFRDAVRIAGVNELNLEHLVRDAGLWGVSTGLWFFAAATLEAHAAWGDAAIDFPETVTIRARDTLQYLRARMSPGGLRRRMINEALDPARPERFLPRQGDNRWRALALLALLGDDPARVATVPARYAVWWARWASGLGGENPG